MSRGSTLTRVAQVVPTLAGLLVIVFGLVHLSPGDPILALAGEHGDQAYYDDMRDRFALDRPLGEQFLVFVARMGGGDLGRSYVQGRPATEVILERVPATLLLTVSALVVATSLGGLLGMVSALRWGGAADRAINLSALVLYAVPIFLVGQVVLLALALGLPLFPVAGMSDPGGGPGGVPGLLDVLHHLALPVLVLASPQLAGTTRVVRSSLHVELAQPYVRTARGKGLGEPAVLRHALRLSLLPVVTLIGNRAGQLLGGAVIVEAIFGWPGLGTLMLDATRNRDAPVLLGIFLAVSVAVVLANLVADLLYAFVDPRVGRGAAGRDVAEGVGWTSGPRWRWDGGRW